MKVREVMKRMYIDELVIEAWEVKIVQGAVRGGAKLPAIKFVRNEIGCDLATAKHLVEAIAEIDAPQGLNQVVYIEI